MCYNLGMDNKIKTLEKMIEKRIALKKLYAKEQGFRNTKVWCDSDERAFEVYAEANGLGFEQIREEI